jgi:multiple antibiotic resistance protein
MDLLSAIILLIIVTDPLGNLPMVMACLEGTRRPLFFVSREVFLAFLILVFFLFIGPVFLRVLGLTEEALRLAGGIILFLIAIKMIFPADTSWMGVHKGEEPILFPLAVPLVAGPSAVATVTLFSAQYPDRMGNWFIAIVVAMLVSLLVFLFAPVLHRFMGHRGLAATERLMGMLLTVIAVQMLITAVREIFPYAANGGG